MNSFRGVATLAASTALAITLALAPAFDVCAQTAPVTDGTPAVDAAITAHHWDQALSELDKRIASNPHDVQAQFKRGTVLARLGRDDDAIAQFTALTQAYPELPEPYNNLAAIYAKQGRYDEARAALVTAIQANPNYGLAYENLGDLYLRLAADSYKRAQGLGHTGGATAQRLSEVQNILSQAPDAAHTASARPAVAVPATTLPFTPSFQFGTVTSGPLSEPYTAPSN